MQTPQRYALAAVLIAASCTGGDATEPDEGVAEDGLSIRDGLRVSPGAVDFGVLELSRTTIMPIELSNTGWLPLVLRPRTVTAGFAIEDDDCGSVLRGRASCTIRVRFTPEVAGAVEGTLTIASLLERHRVALTGSGGRRITVSLAGPGAGRVTSTPAGIDCGTTCSALFTGDVTLTATADDGNRLVGWSGLCGGEAACVVPAGVDRVTATFAGADLRQIAIATAGDAPGFVYVDDDDSDQGAVLCAQPCTAYVPVGHDVHVLGFTPSTFGGWTGCAMLDDSDPHDCGLGAVTTDVAATVMFHRDPREVATLLPPRPVHSVAFMPEGDVVIGDDYGVTRMTLAGDVVWLTGITGGAYDLATDAAGHIYGRGGAGLFALEASGAVRWARDDIAVAPSGPMSFQSAVVVSPDGSVIAAHLTDGVWVVDGNGVDRFTVHGVSADGLAVAADGTVAVGKAADGGLVAAARFTAEGAALPDLGPIPGSAGVSMTYDPSGAVIALTTGQGNAQESRLEADGAVTYSVSEVEEALLTAGGVAVDALGDAVFARWVTSPDFGATGLYFEVVAAGGLLLWTREKSAHARFDIVNDEVTVRAVATDANRHIAFGGAYNQELPWIQILAMP